jgi:hypothetical protein
MNTRETEVVKTITMYAAKDKDFGCYLYRERPVRFNCDGIEYWVGKGRYPISDKLALETVGELKWEDGPIEIEVSIKRKE